MRRSSIWIKFTTPIYNKQPCPRTELQRRTGRRLVVRCVIRKYACVKFRKCPRSSVSHALSDTIFIAILLLDDSLTRRINIGRSHPSTTRRQASRQAARQTGYLNSLDLSPWQTYGNPDLAAMLQQLVARQSELEQKSDEQHAANICCRPLPSEQRIGGLFREILAKGSEDSR